MNKSLKRLILIVGVLLLLAAPFIFMGAGVYSYYQPRLYRSVGAFVLILPKEDSPKLTAAFQKAKEEYPVRMGGPLTARVSLTPTLSPRLFLVTALDVDPQNACNAANIMLVSLSETFRPASPEDLQRINIPVKAEVALAPAYPNVPLIMKVGLLGALFSGGCGITLLIIGWTTRAPKAAGSVPPARP